MGWITDLQQAQWFARRAGDQFGLGDPLCIKAVVSKGCALAYFHIGGRKESEVVVESGRVREVEVVSL